MKPIRIITLTTLALALAVLTAWAMSLPAGDDSLTNLTAALLCFMVGVIMSRYLP